MINREFFINNRKKLFDKLENNSVVLLYSGKELQKSLDENYNFYGENNYYYLTGLNEPEGILILIKNSEGEEEEFLFIPEADKLKEKWVGFKYSPEEAKKLSGIKNVKYTKDVKDFLEALDDSFKYYLDRSQPEYNWYNLDKEFIEDISSELLNLRVIKEKEEIEALKRAVEITHKALNGVVGEIRPGIKEYELAALFEYLIKKYGADSLSFETIAASGENGPILHYVKNKNTLKRGDLILFDLGARFDGYNADVSRTYPISGEFSIIQEKFYKVVLNTQKELISNYKKGIKLRDLQELTKQLFIENLEKEGIPLPEGGIDEWYYHSIGHSLGLDTHDGVNRDLVLEDGMVITCEPGLYAREYGIGIRIEDDILINGDNPIVLTEKIPKEIDDIKNLMK